MLHDVFIVTVSADSYLISHSSALDHPAPLEKFLPPFRLRSRVRIRDVTADHDVWTLWGMPRDQAGLPVRSWRFGSGGAAEAVWEWPSGIPELELGDGQNGCWDLRAGIENIGVHLIATKGTLRGSHSQDRTHCSWRPRRGQGSVST